MSYNVTLFCMFPVPRSDSFHLMRYGLILNKKWYMHCRDENRDTAKKLTEVL